MRIADLLTRGPMAFAGGFFGAFDEPAVGDEILDAREAVDVVDLVEDDEGEDLPDAVDGLKEIKDVGVVFLGRSDDEEFEIREQGIVVIDKHKIDFDALLHTGMWEAFGDASSVGFVGDLFADVREVVLAVGVLNVAEELGTFAHEMHAAAEKIPGRSHLLGIDVGQRDHASAKERTDLVGIDAVVFGLATKDGFHIEGVTEDKGDPVLSTQVSEPVPGKHALDGDDEIVMVRLDDLEESIGPCWQVAVDQNLPVLIDDTDVHRSGVKIDTAVEFMLVGVESHQVSSFVQLIDLNEHIRLGMLGRRP